MAAAPHVLLPALLPLPRALAAAFYGRGCCAVAMDEFDDMLVDFGSSDSEKKK
jgi:hypothetical protein